MAKVMEVWRAWEGRSQADAAKIAGVSLTTWSRWERGTHPIPYREWQRLKELIFKRMAPWPYTSVELLAELHRDDELEPGQGR
jgi:DNA-binding XRE family transcriptional regulator